MVKLLLACTFGICYNRAGGVNAIDYIAIHGLNHLNVLLKEERLLVVGDAITEGNRNQGLATLVKLLHSKEVAR